MLYLIYKLVFHVSYIFIPSIYVKNKANTTYVIGNNSPSKFGYKSGDNNEIDKNRIRPKILFNSKPYRATKLKIE